MGANGVGPSSGSNSSVGTGLTSGSTGGGNTPTPGASPLPNQQVAPLTGQQLQAADMTSQETGPTSGLLNSAIGEQSQIAGGSLMSPSGMNPAMQSYYNAMAQPMVSNYQNAVAPNILSTAAQTGTLGSPNTNQAFGTAEQNLSSGLANLGAEIAEPAYATNLNATMQAGANAPSLATGGFVPATELATSGATLQNQAQNVLNAQYQNENSAAMWPYQELNMLGQGLGLASGGAGTSTSLGTSGATGAGGMK